MPFVCSECGLTCRDNYNLKRHQNNCVPSSNKAAQYCCFHCGKRFNRKDNFIHHVKRCHIQGNRRPCRTCPLCCSKFHDRVEIETHFAEDHQITLEKTSLSVENLDAFDKWKSDIENSSATRFVVERSWNKTKTSRVFYYRCFRSGSSNVKPMESRKRRPTLLGTHKIGAFCPARIITKTLGDGTISINYISTHVGHDFNVARLPLTKSYRKSLAEKLKEEIPMSDIIASERERAKMGTCDPEIQRCSMLITRKHLHNVAKEFGIRRDKDGRFHGKDEIHDAVSVEQWVRKNVASDAICVRYCKFQGEIDCDHAELRSDDFVLILMSNVQVEMLKLFGNIVCVDGTHGTNGYGSDITTVLVLNGHNEGFPVATMFSNRSDSQTISIFFSYIQKLCGEINCNVFMTDTTELYFRAWCKTIGTPVHRFFCSWHVEKDWKKNLNKVEGDQSLKILVYEKIRMTQMESNVYAFRRMFDTLMSDLLGNAKTRNFGEYVHDRYTNSTRNWAFCYRRSAGINSSTHVERMHGIFRHFYVQGKKIKRLDKAIYALEAFIRSKLSEAVPQRGILTRKLQTLHRNHTIFQKENERMKVLQLHDGEWVVISATQFELFNVLQVRRSCDDCFMKCDLCEVCCHSHVCTCTDSSIRGNMCKHIHKVCFETNNYDYAEGPTVELANDGFYEESDNESAECVIRGILGHPTSDGSNIEEERDKVRKQFEDVLLTANNQEQLSAIRNTLDFLKATISSLRQK